MKIGIVTDDINKSTAMRLWPDAQWFAPGGSTMGHRLDLIVVILGRNPSDEWQYEIDRWVREVLPTRLAKDGRIEVFSL